MSRTDSLNGDVFVNCPFDAGFLDVFRAIVFAIKACGFVPHTALDRNDSGDVRIEKIRRLIGDCDRNIHDLSAVALDRATNLPRFNMPLELGLSLGALWYGDARQQRKRILVLDEKPHQYDASTSDISGQDIMIHRGKPADAIKCVRNWLAEDRNDDLPPLPGGVALAGDYRKLCAIIRQMIKVERKDPWKKLGHNEFVRCLDAGFKLLVKDEI